MNDHATFFRLFLALFAPFLLAFSAAYGQQKTPENIPKDTTFNVKSVYKQEKKQYPFVEIVEPNLPEDVNEDRNVVYAHYEDTPFGRRDLHLDVFYPKNADKTIYPGIIMIHGGGWRSGDRSHMVPLAQKLAAEGYVAVAVEYRLSLEAKYPAGLIDVNTAIQWMKTNAGKYHLNAQKMAFLGASSGAQMASLLGAAPDLEKFQNDFFPDVSTEVQAVVNIDGILSFVHPEAAAEGEAAGAWLGGGRKEAAANWQEASALEYVDADTPPFLFINSAHPRFHAGRDDFIKKLDRYGTYHDMHTIPDTPHPFWLLHPWFDETFTYTHQFLDKVFK